MWNWQVMRIAAWFWALLLILLPVAAEACAPPSPPQGDRTVAFSHNGKRVIDAELRLWDVASGKLIRSVGKFDRKQHHNYGSLAFSSDDRYVLTAHGEAVLWEVATGKVIRKFEGQKGTSSSAAFSPDGKYILFGGKQTLALWDAATGELIRNIEEVPSIRPSDESGGCSWLPSETSAKTATEYGYVTSIAFSPDGSHAAVAREYTTLKLWDVSSGRRLCDFEGDSVGITTIAFSPSGKHILGGKFQTLYLWNAATGRLIWSATLPNPPGSSRSVWINSVAFSPDGTRIVSGSGGNLKQDKLQLWDAASGHLISSISSQQDVKSVAFSPNGASFLSYQTSPSLWDTNSGKLIRAFEDRRDTFNTARFSRDGAHILSKSASGPTAVWDTNTGVLIRRVDVLNSKTGDEHEAIAAFSHDGGNSISSETVSDFQLPHKFSPDGTQFLTVEGGKTLVLEDTRDGKLIRKLDGHMSVINAIAFSPDGTRVVSGGYDSQIKLWDVNTGKLIRDFEGYFSSVTQVTFSPDGKYVLSGSRDKELSLWDVATSKLVRNFRGHQHVITAIAFSPDGAHILSAAMDGERRLWETSTGKLVVALRVDDRSDFLPAAFSPDNTRFIIAGPDNMIQLRETSTGALIRGLTGHQNPVTSLAFSPNGKRLLSGADDSTMRMWDADTGKELVQMRVSSREWLTMTPAGYFDGSENGLNLLTILRGDEVVPIEQYRDKLMRKDLVRAVLAGDAHQHDEEAVKLSNQKIVETWHQPNDTATQK